MSYDDNPVTTPEKYGFESVGGLNLENEPYEFYILEVLKNEQGYYLVTDSGCSCPTPWEYTTVEDLTGPLTAEQAREEIISLTPVQRDEYRSGPDDPTELLALIND